MWPDLFSLPFSQVGAMILCGLAQAWLLFVLTHRLVRPVNPRWLRHLLWVGSGLSWHSV